MKKIFLTFLLFLLSVNLFGKQGITMNKKVRIDIISDVVCPWCAIGYNRLHKAITDLGVEEKIEIVWHPFELNPDMAKDGIDDKEYLMNKYSLNEEQLKKTREQITDLGKEVDFTFDYFSNMKKLNTLNAHILLNYAKKFNKQTQLKTNLQKAYFSDRKDINNKEVLKKELEFIGLNSQEGLKLLDNPEEIIKIKNEEEYWKNRGVYSVPTMFFNEKEVYIGALSVGQYKEILTALLKK